MKQPFAKSWWVVEGKFLAGCYPGCEEPEGTADRVSKLAATGIRTFISLQEPDERNRSGKRFADYQPILRDLEANAGGPLSFHRFPVGDCTAPSPAVAAKVLDTIDASLAEGRPVYVHCWGGNGRTGAIVGCWLVRHGRCAADALAEVMRLRAAYPELAGSPAPQVESQYELVRRWARLEAAGGSLCAAEPQTRTAGSQTRLPGSPTRPSEPHVGSASSLRIGAEPLGLHDRYLGAMLGLAVGDAVGTALEFKPPGTFAPIRDMIGGGPFGLEPGQWTDDTSMALCLAESLVHTADNDPSDQMRRYVAWWEQGHLSATGKCFDIGGTTRAALSRFLKTGHPFAGSANPHSAGNGSLMRLAPVPLAYRSDLNSAVFRAAESSRTTHAAAEAIDACRFMSVLLVRAVEGASRDELLAEDLWDRATQHPTGPLAPKVLAVARGSYKRKDPPAIRGTGYVVDCLEAALWAFHRHDDYEQSVLAAANLGDDADTTAAVCGQLAGAHYGLSGIPTRWLNRVAMRDTIAELARGLLTLSRLFQERALSNNLTQSR